MIIGISGKKQSGKDTVGKIIQILTQSPHFTDEAVEKFLKREVLNPKFKNKKFADKLKDTICMWIGCTREQLEDEKFKNTELPEDWWYYKMEHDGGYSPSVSDYKKGYPNNWKQGDGVLIKPTPRLLLQLVGTECGREIIHPNIWVNSLMADYVTKWYYEYDDGHVWFDKKDKSGHLIIFDSTYNSKEASLEHVKRNAQNWVITDMRFPNEMEAVKARDGITIRVDRWIDEELTKEEAINLFHQGVQIYAIDDMGVETLITDLDYFSQYSRFATEVNRDNEHVSETALDDCKDFDYEINNNKRLIDLIYIVRLILVREKII